MGNLEGPPLGTHSAIAACTGTVDPGGDQYVCIFKILPPPSSRLLSSKVAVDVRTINNGVCEVYLKYPQMDVAALVYSGLKYLRPNCQWCCADSMYFSHDL